MLVNNAMKPNVSDVMSVAWFYVAIHFWLKCWHYKAGIIRHVLNQKMGMLYFFVVFFSSVKQSNWFYVCDLLPQIAEILYYFGVCDNHSVLQGVHQ